MSARSDPAALLAGLRQGDVVALARAITAIENQTDVGVELASALGPRPDGFKTLGVTGAPGAGKSTLINALLYKLLPGNPRIGVLTVDPSSPITGGAVLADRVRMAAFSANPNVFIRSLSARGHLGGVTRTTSAVIDVLAAAGMDLTIVETVGTGQSEVEVAGLTDVRIAVCAPGLGDEMQALKAGILEVADLIVVSKADLPDAGRTIADLKAMLRHRGHDERRVALKVSSTTGDGMMNLISLIEQYWEQAAPRTSSPAPEISRDRAMLSACVSELTAVLIRESRDPLIDAIADNISIGRTSRHEGALVAMWTLLKSQGELPRNG